MSTLRRAAGLAAGVVAGLAVAEFWRARQRRLDASNGSPRRAPVSGGRIHRSARLARMSARTTADLATTRTRQLGKSAEQRAHLEDEFHLRTAEQVMDLMGEMKGALMKIGQLLSFIDTGLPEPYRQALASLQADAPPMAPELVAEVVEDELGLPPEKAFDEFSAEALAAASIGQVHAARTHDGRDVVVKVQYPGVDEAIRADLENADLLYTLMRAVYPNLDPKPVVDEMRERIGEELDYEHELRNQQAFLDHYRGHPFIRIPEVHPELSSARILTMDRVRAARWTEALEAPEDLRQRWAEVIFRFAFGTINRFHMFNGDPHPGNYLFHDDGTVTFLDYGCVKHFALEHMVEQRAMLKAELDGDAETMRAKLVKFGFIHPDDDLDPARYVEWFRQWDGHLLLDEFTYTPEFAEAAVRANYDPTGEWSEVTRRMNLPRDFVFLTRINLGLNSILAGLGARNRWRAIADEWWEGAGPVTELGRLDAAFYASAV